VKRKVYIGDLPSSFLSCEWISIWYINNDFVFTSKNNFAIVRDLNYPKNALSVLKNKKIEKYFVRNHLQIFSCKFKCKIKNAYVLENISSVCRTYSKRHDLESMVFEFYKINLKPVLNMDRVSNAVVHVRDCYEKLKNISLQEKRWHVVLTVQKTLENINLRWVNTLLSMIE
jgi:hypothetical protein